MSALLALPAAIQAGAAAAVLAMVLGGIFFVVRAIQRAERRRIEAEQLRQQIKDATDANAIRQDVSRASDGALGDRMRRWTRPE